MQNFNAYEKEWFAIINEHIKVEELESLASFFKGVQFSRLNYKSIPEVRVLLESSK